MILDETKFEIDRTERYIWSAVDCDTLEVLANEVSPGRSSLNALLFLRNVLERCYVHPLVRVDRGPWYGWPLGYLNAEYER